MSKTLVNTVTQQGGGGVKPSHVAGFNSFDIKKFVAFTLAETLIVIGIIGVVASLTIPNLNSTTADREAVTRVKKVYANLLEAESRAEAVYGPIDEWFTSDMDDEAIRNCYLQRITEFLKVTKTCNHTAGCFAQNRKFRGQNSDYDITNGNSYVLADGTSIYFDEYDGNNPVAKLDIAIDTDGVKGKNVIGSDMFYVPVDEETGKIDSAYYVRIGGEDGLDGVNISDFADLLLYFQLEWVLRYGNMDYLKVDDNGICPDGKTVLKWGTQTSCK